MPYDLTGAGFSEAESLPPRDHNNPPGLLVGEPLLQRVRLSHAKLFERASELLAAEERAPKAEDGKTLVCLDDEWERKMTETVSQLGACSGKMDVARMAEMEPYRSNMNGIHGLFREVMDKMVDPDPKKSQAGFKYRLERALTVYKNKKLEAERKRREEEAEKQRKAEAELLAKQQEEERKRREEEDARQAQIREEQRKADEAARQALEAANRKRNEENRIAAQAEAERLAKEAAEKKRLADAESAKIEAERKAREEADAKEAADAAEKRAAAEATAAAPAASLSRSRSANAQSGLREFVNFRDVSRERVDLERLRDHIPSDALDQAIGAYIRANSDMIKEEIKNRRQPVRGVTFFIDSRTDVR